MTDQRRKKHRFLSALSSPFRALKSRMPPKNAVQPGVALSSSGCSAVSLAGSSRILFRVDDSHIVSQRTHQRGDQNTHKRSIAMFSDIDQAHISGGNFTLIGGDYMPKHLAFHSLPRSRDAAFSAAINLDNLARRPCSKGTRVDIIAQIMTWVNETDPTNAPPVYWLTGLAGLGKTTIAYTICNRNSKLLVTTLCRDLAELYDSYADCVSSILEINSKAVDADLRIQIDELLAKPWQASIAQRKDLPPPIVVVDALDECDRGTEFLEGLLHAIRAGQLAGIKFLVTSRPDPKIVDICKSFPPNAVCKLHEVDTGNVQNDIEKYLREALPQLKDEPGLALLSQRAGGFFIYATTAVRFISPPHNPPSVSEMRSHLQAMLNPEPLTHPDSDERLLVDELYERILGDAFRDARVRTTRVRILHTIVCAESRIDMSVLGNLSNTDQDTVERVVESLHAVLFVSPKDGCVYWYHASFPEFVFSEARARINVYRNPTPQVIDVFCDARAYHGVLTRRCFSVMHEYLHFNMCSLPSSYIFDSEVPGLNVSIDRVFTSTLRYVSRHWARHLLQTVPAKNDTDDLFCDLKDFLGNKLIFWIEAMNLIGAKFECSSLLKDAESWFQMGKEWPDFLGQLNDATNFSAFFAGSPASKSTPHLYISALSMWNQDSPVWRNWRDRFGSIPSISLPRDISIPLLTIPTTDWVLCIAFSPDGNRIVSGSYDKSVQVWGANAGERLKEMQGHTAAVASVAFSPDGSQIISGSGDASVRVWDAKTGEQLRVLQGHTGRVTSVAFSSDGSRIVSGSSDNSVLVWDTKSGEQLMELQGHTDSVTSVAFSPDGHRIVSSSYDESVRVCDAKTGDQLQKLQGHTSGVISVSFSLDGNQIVSGSETSVRVWDTKTGDQLRKVQVHTRPVTSVAWDAKPHGHTDSVTSVAFSVSKQIVTGSRDKSVRVWDTDGEQLRELQGHTKLVTSVAISPSGHRIVSGSYDKTLRVWDAEPHGHTASVTFPSDRNQILSGSWNQSAQVWDNPNPDASWVVNEDGWILSGTEMLVWVPSSICNVLLCPHNMLTVSRNGSATISFSQRKLGTHWDECYTP